MATALASVLLAPAKSHAASAAPPIAMGDELLASGRFLEARAAFDAVLAARPDDVSALVGLARADYALGHVLAADTLLARAHELAPNDHALAIAASEARSAHFADAVASYLFGWGNGQSWQLAGINPRWHPNATSSYGLVAERYSLADPSGFVIDQRLGINASFGDVDAFEVRVRALDSQYNGYPTQFNGALDVLGSVHHFRYEASVSRTGIEAAPSAQVDLITTAGAGKVLDNLTGRIGWASKSTSAFLRGRATDFSDGNKYSLIGFGAMQDLGISAFDLELGGFVNESGYAFTYPLAAAGYYTYPHESELALQAIVRFSIGPHFEASAIGNAGTAQTVYRAGYQNQTRQQFLPALMYTNRDVTLSASGSFSQYLGAAYIRNFQGNNVGLSLTTRL
ncbi:MAG: tetratricopeptide repeat protein [Candidatus Eremiobacteraeota bacterium]|nr:tetratricopeptide repeat protein [Candidatus Eremiobacteraeota bacterium]MBV8282820.1 tetratricopeptide repeat protein [Candidatus Eremiobacteraeota bacterium]